MRKRSVLNILVVLGLLLSLHAPPHRVARASESSRQPATPSVDIVFAMDTSGSMSDEFSALCDSIDDLIASLRNLGIQVRYQILGIYEPRLCATSTAHDAVSAPTTDDKEDWGPAIRDLSVGYPWQPGAMRLIIPVTDEAPEDGYPCEVPGPDEDAIDQAITAALANRVRVAPILGSGYDQCTDDLAFRLAYSTAGHLFFSTIPAEDMAEGIIGLIGAVAADRDGDGILDDDDPFPDDPCQPDPQAVCYPEQVCGVNNNAHWDDDNDGRIDEEVENLKDDDDDGLIDEDVGGPDCPYAKQDCGVNSHRGFDDDDDGITDEEADNGRDDDGDTYIDEDVTCPCPPQQDLGVDDTPGIDDDHDFRTDEEADDGVDDDGDGCVDEDVGASTARDTWTEEEFTALLDEKEGLIKNLSQADETWLGYTVPEFDLNVVNYDESAAEDLVSAYRVSGLPDDQSASRFGRLVLAEDAVYELYQQSVTVGDLAGKAVAQLVWMNFAWVYQMNAFEAFTSYPIFDDILTRFANASSRFIDWGISQTDLSAPTKALSQQLVDSATELIGGQELFKTVFNMTIHYAVTSAVVSDVIEKTQPAIDDAVTAAQSGTVPIAGTHDEAAGRLDQEVSQNQTIGAAVTQSVESRIQASGFADGLADLAGIVVQSISIWLFWSTIAWGAWAILNIYADLELIIAVGESLGYVSDTEDLALKADDIAFDPGYMLVSSSVQPSFLHVEQLASAGYIMVPARNQETVAHFDSVRTQLALDRAVFEEELAKTVALAQVGDSDGLSAQLDPLAEASMQLYDTFESGTRPVFALAEGAIRDFSGARDAYDSMFVDAQVYDGEMLQLYASLLHAVEEPDSPGLREEVAQQAQAVLGQIEKYEGSFARTSRLVETLPLPPTVFIANHTIIRGEPEGEITGITLDIHNTSPTQAEEVRLDLVPLGKLQLLSPESLLLGQFGPDERREVQLSLKVSPPTGAPALMAYVEADGYTAPMYMMILPSADAGATAPVGAGGGGGLGIAVLLLGVAIGGVFLYTLRRRRPGRIRAATAQKARLVASSGQQYIITQPASIIGRGSSCAVRLPDPAVSRRHAIIRYAQGRWFIQDQGSTAGTFVNGQRVQATALNAGDRIRIGDTEFEFRAG